MLDQPGGQVLVEDGVGLVGARMGLILYGREVTGSLCGGTVTLNDINMHEPKSVLEVEKTSGNSQRPSPRVSITDGDHPEQWRSKTTSRRRGGRRSQRLRKLVR